MWLIDHFVRHCAKLIHMTTGVEVEVLVGAQNVSPRIVDAEQMGATAFFESYADQTGMSEAARLRGFDILKVMLTKLYCAACLTGTR